MPGKSKSTGPGKPSASFRIRGSGIHGRGAFATRAIPAGERVCEYVGERVTKAEATRRCLAGNPFIFILNQRHDLDGDVPYNRARFFNHCCAPNCEASQVRGRIWLVALRDIAAGEELTFNYGYDLADYRDHPCRCGAGSCLGFIVAPEFHEQIRRASARPTTPQPNPSTAQAAGPSLGLPRPRGRHGRLAGR